MQASSSATAQTVLRSPNQTHKSNRTTANNQNAKPNQSTPFPQSTLTQPQNPDHSEGFPARLRASLQQGPFIPAPHIYVTPTTKNGWEKLGHFAQDIAYKVAKKVSENIKSILTAIPDEAEKNKIKDAISTCIVSMLLAKTTKEEITLTKLEALFQTLRETITNVKGLEKPAATAQAIVAIVGIHIANTINEIKKKVPGADAR